MINKEAQLNWLKYSIKNDNFKWNYLFVNTSKKRLFYPFLLTSAETMVWTQSLFYLSTNICHISLKQPHQAYQWKKQD